MIRGLTRVGGVRDAAQHGRECQERCETLSSALPGGYRLGVVCSRLAGRDIVQGFAGVSSLGTVYTPP